MGHSDWERCARVFMGLVVILSVRISSGYTDLRDVTAVNSLYVALGYPPLPGWVPIGGDPCLDGWQGIQCVNSNITGLILNGANLGGELSGNLDLFTSLIQMDLSNNHIGGSIPSNLPPTIMQLFLSDNQFSGSIPVNLSSFTQLSAVSLNNNHLTGGIPDAFQQLTSLINMDLSSNSLSGQLPPSMGNLLALTTLHLQNNQISGVLDVLQDLPLNELNIENNLFSGPIPAKLLSIPNFRKDGNPFNTTILPPPPTSPPTSPPSSAPAMPPPSLGIANWTASSPETLTPPGSSNFFTNKRIVWISIAGVILLAAIALGLCLLKSRCCGGRQVTYKMTSRDKLGAFATKNPKYKEYLLQSNNQMEKVTTEVVMGPQDGYGTDHRKVGLSSKPQDEQERDGKTINAISRHKKDHKIDMTEWGVNNMPLLPSPPLPPVLPHNSVDEAMVKPSVPAGMAIRSHPLKSLSSQISVSYFSVGLLQQYTNSFSQGNLIGEGTLGSVYRAELPDGKLLAVKKLQPAVSRQLSDDGFLNLVSSISKLQHVNVVKLVGYCAEYGQRLLVHEYCRNGTLNDALHLEDEIHSKLSWSARIRIALGAARALEYLHEVCRPLVVHHNFKSANVLLDDELSVCISDCGLAPLLSSGSANGLTGHLLSAQGYVAPELELGSYTYQSDIYCFGVVMLELLTGRRSYDRSRPRTEQFLVRWAAPQLHDIDALSRMVDPSLKGSYPSKSLSHFADIISLCLQPEPEFRPPMSEIVQDLLYMIEKEPQNWGKN
ncbi:hypothetical protein AAG906_028584 [Vitis piasezkii]